MKADDVIRDIGSSPSLSSAISSLRALRANRAATSRRSCFCEDTSPRQGIVEHRPRNIAPLLRVILRDDDHISRYPKRIQYSTQPNHLLRLTYHRRLNYKEVEVTIDPCVTPAVRPKEDHLPVRRRSCSQKTARSVHDLRSSHGTEATAASGYGRSWDSNQGPISYQDGRFGWSMGRNTAWILGIRGWLAEWAETPKVRVLRSISGDIGRAAICPGPVAGHRTAESNGRSKQLRRRCSGLRTWIWALLGPRFNAA